jgi:hypothetical protein
MSPAMIRALLSLVPWWGNRVRHAGPGGASAPASLPDRSVPGRWASRDSASKARSACWLKAVTNTTIGSAPLPKLRSSLKPSAPGI